MEGVNWGSLKASGAGYKSHRKTPFEFHAVEHLWTSLFICSNMIQLYWTRIWEQFKQFGMCKVKCRKRFLQHHNLRSTSRAGASTQPPLWPGAMTPALQAIVTGCTGSGKAGGHEERWGNLQLARQRSIQKFLGWKAAQGDSCWQKHRIQKGTQKKLKAAPNSSAWYTCE